MRKPARLEVASSNPWKAAMTSGSPRRSVAVVTPSLTDRRTRLRASLSHVAIRSSPPPSRSTRRVVRACRRGARRRTPGGGAGRRGRQDRGAVARGSTLTTIARSARASSRIAWTSASRTAAASGASRSHSGPCGAYTTDRPNPAERGRGAVPGRRPRRRLASHHDQRALARGGVGLAPTPTPGAGPPPAARPRTRPMRPDRAERRAGLHQAWAGPALPAPRGRRRPGPRPAARPGR